MASRREPAQDSGQHCLVLITSKLSQHADIARRSVFVPSVCGLHLEARKLHSLLTLNIYKRCSDDLETHRERSKMCKWTLSDERIVDTLADETLRLAVCRFLAKKWSGVHAPSSLTHLMTSSFAECSRGCPASMFRVLGTQLQG